MAWFWLNIPLALLFFCCWALIPLWLTLTRWHTELGAKHAEIAARQAEIAASAIPVQAVAQPAVADEAGSLAYVGVADLPGR
jgi:hypothetical protein